MTETGRFSSDEEKAERRLQRCVRAALHQSGVDASPVCGHVNFMTSIYLSSYLVINLASCTCTFFTLAYNSLWVCSKKYSTPNHKHSLKCILPSDMCIHMFLLLCGLPIGVLCFSSAFQLSNVSQSFTPPSFYPSSPALSPSWPCVFHTSVAFAFPAL